MWRQVNVPLELLYKRQNLLAIHYKVERWHPIGPDPAWMLQVLFVHIEALIYQCFLCLHNTFGQGNLPNICWDISYLFILFIMSSKLVLSSALPKGAIKTYLLLRQDPIASSAALLQKFSEAINSSPEHCLFFSSMISWSISGSSLAKVSCPVHTLRICLLLPLIFDELMIALYELFTRFRLLTLKIVLHIANDGEIIVV